MRNHSNRKIDVSRSATCLMRLLLSTPDESALLTRIRWFLLTAARSAMVRIFDPFITYDFYGRKLCIPLSHDLPLHRRAHPLYSDNLGRVAAQIAKKYPEFSIIDIGANIGDSVAILRHHTQGPILCIEGEPSFVNLLAENTHELIPAPIIEPYFIAGQNLELKATLHNGTAELSYTEANKDGIRTKSLGRILAEHPEFGQSKLLKLDTDGMDVAILTEALPWISRQRPVLFFEYDPDLQRAHAVDSSLLFRNLKQAGYCHVLVYENTGDYMLSLQLENEKLLSELHDFYSGRGSLRYCDLCIFHTDDSDEAESLRLAELRFFRSSRRY